MASGLCHWEITWFVSGAQGRTHLQGPHAASRMEPCMAWHWGRGTQRPALPLFLTDEVATASGALCSSVVRGWLHA